MQTKKKPSKIRSELNGNEKDKETKDHLISSVQNL